MKWETHKRITYLVCREFGLSDYLCRRVAEASILPDKEPDYKTVCKSYGRKRKRVRCYQVPVRHHGDEAVGVAFRYLFKARKKLLHRRDYVIELGKALHYLQDYAVNPTTRLLGIFSVRDDELHEKLEEALRDIPVDLAPLREARSTRCYPHEFPSKVLARGSSNKPEEVMKTAVYNTALAFKVLLEPDRPLDLERRYKRWRIIHIALVLLPWLLPLLTLNPYMAFLSILGSLFLHEVDVPYHNAKVDYEWFRP